MSKRHYRHHTCDLCNGVNSDRCPNNEPETVTSVCPVCNGEGTIYYDGYTGETVPKDVWGMLPEKYQETEICQNCEGEGYIEVEAVCDITDEEDE